MKKSFVLFLVAVGFCPLPLLADGAAGPQEQVKTILREDGFWDIASTTGFFKHNAPATILPVDALLQTGVRGSMLGIGTLTETVPVRSPGPWQFREVPSGTSLFREVFKGPALIQRMLWEFDAAFEAAAREPRLMIALKAGDLEQAFHDRRVAVLLGLDTGSEIGEDLHVLRMYHRLGLRKLALVHASGTSWADSITGKRPGGESGLSSFGQEVVHECNRLGILVDVSHASDKTFWDTLAASTKPLIATHSGARAVANVARNLTDDMMRALAAKGGMIGVCGLFDEAEARKSFAAMNAENIASIGLYLSSKFTDPYALASALGDPREREEAVRELKIDRSREYDFMSMPGKNALTARILLDHLDHIVKVVGIENVGIGTDLNMARDGYPDLVEKIVTEMVQRGYTRVQIRQMLHGNFFRFYRKVTAETPSE